MIPPLPVSRCPALHCLSRHLSGNLSLLAFFPTLGFLPPPRTDLLFLFSVLVVTLRSTLLKMCFAGVLTPCCVFGPPPSLSVCVVVGGRGGCSLHPFGSTPDPAAIQAGGESRQEHFPVPQEALL